MSDCISLISHPVPENISQWQNVSHLSNVLHTQCIDIVSVASGSLKAEPFCVEGLDCRLVGALVYHCCDEGAIHSWDDVVISHVSQQGDDTCVNLQCWDLEGKQYDGDLEVCWEPDACKRAYDLRCCLMSWAKIGKKKKVSFRDWDEEVSYLSEARLMQMINEAESECSINCGQNNRVMNFKCGC